MYCNEIAGKAYQSVYELNNRKFTFVPLDSLETDDYHLNDSENLSNDDQNIESDITVHNDTKRVKLNENLLRGDNSFYVDTNTAQKLKDCDINELKNSGLTGGEIIKTLIENSETFKTKTDFAQEKWIKRKEKKYSKLVK